MTPTHLIAIADSTSPKGCQILALAELTGSGGTKCPVLEYFTDIQRTKPLLLKKIHTEIRMTAANGPSPNETKFRHLKGWTGIVEFKAKVARVGAIRLFGFIERNSVIICTHASGKENEREMQQEYARAELMRTHYFTAIHDSPLPIVPLQ